MFSSRKLYVVIPLISLISIAFAGHKKEVFVRFAEEKVNNLTFAYRVDVADGARKERWTIDGAQVSEAAYEEALLDAQKAERRAERKLMAEGRRQEEMELVRQQEFARKARFEAGKKRLTLTLVQVEEALTKVKDSRLEPYYLFNATTFLSAQDFNALSTELIPQARALLARSDDELEGDDLNEMLARLELQPSRLHELFRATVKHAIDTCSDTRTLKELIEMVA